MNFIGSANPGLAKELDFIVNYHIPANFMSHLQHKVVLTSPICD